MSLSLYTCIKSENKSKVVLSRKNLIENKLLNQSNQCELPMKNEGLFFFPSQLNDWGRAL